MQTGDASLTLRSSKRLRPEAEGARGLSPGVLTPGKLPSDKPRPDKDHGGTCGYWYDRELIKGGAFNFVVAPRPLENQRSKHQKIDRLDARALLKDKPVAVLGPLPAQELDPKQKVELDEMQLRFAEAGLQLRRPIVLLAKLPKVRTMPAPNNRTNVVTVEEMRRARDW